MKFICYGIKYILIYLALEILIYFSIDFKIRYKLIWGKTKNDLDVKIGNMD